MCKLLVYSQIRNAKRFRISIVAVLNWLPLVLEEMSLFAPGRPLGRGVNK